MDLSIIACVDRSLLILWYDLSLGYTVSFSVSLNIEGKLLLVL
jgi:hypothetical protein